MKRICIAAIVALSFLPVPAMAQAVSVELDRFELQQGQGDDPFLFDSTVSVGGNRFGAVLKAEGGHETGRFDIEDVESKAMIAFYPNHGTTLMAGVRHDFHKGPDLTFATIAVEQSLGPLLDGEHYFFLSEDGDMTGAGQLLARLPITPSLIFEPRFAVSWSAQEIPQEETGSGITEIELSVRLRQAIGPVFNIYVGGVHERFVGNTRDIALANGDRANVTRALIGGGFSF